MNALWLNRMSNYKHSSLAFVSAREILRLKIEREALLLRRYKRPAYTPVFPETGIVADLLVIEARAAHHFWHEFASLVPEANNFNGRIQHGADTANRLLDIGFHHVMNVIKKFLVNREVPPDLGLLHSAHRMTSDPLVYDLIELFRADIVDTEVLRFLRLKKRKVIDVNDEIPHFVHELNQRLNRLHYLAQFKQCHTYKYYMEVQILHFIHAVNHKEIFIPIHLPARHDMRCLTPNTSMID
jgi:CRISPR-associated endonuclease Cas1